MHAEHYSTNSALSHLSDAELAALSRTSREAADYMLQKYAPLVRARASSYFLAGADREDIVQEGMIGLYKAIRDYKEHMASFCGFADLCIKRQIISAIKSANRQKHQPLNGYVSLSRPVFGEEADNEFIDFAVLEHISDPESIFIDKEKADALQHAICLKLSPLEQRVMQLYVAGMPYCEIALRLHISEKSVDNALQRVKNKLAELSPSGVPAS